jgi:DHA1 family multidrug resistance protein-like MFS transporter
MSEYHVRGFFGLFLLGFLASFGSVVSPVLPQYAQRLGASSMEIGLFFSAYSLTWTFLQLCTGYLSDKYGRKRFVILGLSVYGLSLILSGFSQNFIQLVIFRVLQGVGLGFFGPACLGLVARMREKGKGFALYRTANSLGLMLGPIIGGIVGSINVSYPFYAGGLLSLLAISAVFLVHEGERHEGGTEKFLASLRGMVLTKKIIFICLATFMVELAFASLDLIIPLFGSARGFSPASIGIILSSYFIAFTLSQIPISIVSEKINKKVLIIFCSFAGALPFILLSHFLDVVAMSLALGALGVTLGTVFVQSSALVAEIAPEDKKSLYMAFFDSIIDYSFVIMPPIATYAFTYAPTMPFILCAFLMIIAGMIFMKE